MNKILHWLTRMRHRTSTGINRWALIPLRLVVGYGFIAHGYAKLIRGPDQFAAILSALGMPLPGFLAWLTVAVEICGGLAVLAGALLPLAAVPLAATLLVAMFTVHLPFGFSSIKLQAVVSGHPTFGQPGYEIDLLYLACLITLVLDGPGPVAVDNLLRGKGDNPHGQCSDQTR